jgi:hypothetical protein
MKHIYLIPGLGSTCAELQYKNFITALREAGYTVTPINPDWRKPLSTQHFTIAPNSLIITHSIGHFLGSRLARANQSSCLRLSPTSKAELARLTPLLEKHMTKQMARAFVVDIRGILPRDDFSVAGLKEIKFIRNADLYIQRADHRITQVYINAVVRMLQAIF